MGPGVGAQRRGPVPEGCLMKSIMTALAPLKSRHSRLGQSLWWLWVCVRGRKQVNKALHTCTSWYAYAAMFGSSIDTMVPRAL